MDPIYDPERDPASRAGHGGKAGPDAKVQFGAWKQQGDHERGLRYMRAFDGGLVAEIAFMQTLAAAVDGQNRNHQPATAGYGSVLPQKAVKRQHLDDAVTSLHVQPGDLKVLAM